MVKKSSHKLLQQLSNQSDLTSTSGNKLAKRLAMEARLKQIEYKSMEGLRRVIAER